ncbi:MAG: Uma2 family endonuclease [Anaerolineae bacterium]
MTMLGFSRGQCRQNIMFTLWQHDKDEKSGITIFGVGHLVLPNLILEADVSFTSHQRVAKIPKLYMPAAPNFVAEVIRVSTVVEHQEAKARLFLRGGTQVVWIVNCENQCVTVYTPGSVQTYGTDDTLNGSAFLIGFQMAVKDIFDRR